MSSLLKHSIRESSLCYARAPKCLQRVNHRRLVVPYCRQSNLIAIIISIESGGYYRCHPNLQIFTSNRIYCLLKIKHSKQVRRPEFKSFVSSIDFPFKANPLIDFSNFYIWNEEINEMVGDEELIKLLKFRSKTTEESSRHSLGVFLGLSRTTCVSIISGCLSVTSCDMKRLRWVFGCH